MKKLFFFFIFIFLFSFSVYSLSYTNYGVLFNESFNYSDAYSNHGWAYTENDPAGCWSTTPYTLSGITGWGGSNIAGCNGWGKIKRSDLTNFHYRRTSSNDILIEFHFRYTNDASTPTYSIGLSENDPAGGNPDIEFFGQNQGEVRKFGVTQCTFSLGAGTTHHGQWVWGSSDNIDLYINDVLVCETTLPRTSTVYDWLRVQSTFVGNSAEQVIDDIIIMNVTIDPVSETECSEPILFCDNFNYVQPISDANDWIVLNGDASYNTVFSPTNNTMLWESSNPVEISHTSKTFATEYQIGDSSIVYESFYAPSFSNEFNISMRNETVGLLDFETFDHTGEVCFRGRFTTKPGLSYVNLSIQNSSTNAYEVVGSFTSGVSTPVKFNPRFTMSGRTLDCATCPNFNTSFLHNEVFLFINGVPATVASKGFNYDCENIWTSEFEKATTTNVTIDEYLFYYGVDSVTNTLDFGLVEIESDPFNISVEVIPNLPPDMIDTVDGFWESIGLRSQTSKTIAGMLFLTIFTLGIISIMIKTGHFSLGGLVVADFVVMIMLSIAGLLPIWIVLVFAIIGAGLGALAVKSMM